MANVNLNWDESIGAYTVPTVKTATTYALANADGVSSTVFTGTGFTYSGNTPTAGTITSVALVFNSGSQTMLTLTGLNVNLAAVGALETAMTNVRSAVTWFAVVDQDPSATISTSTQIRLPNTDGTFTDILGSGLGVNGGPLTGTVTHLEHIAANGTTVLTDLTYSNVALGTIAGGLFDSNAAMEIFFLMNSGSNTLTGGLNGISFGGNVYYTDMLDGPGNDSIIASAQQSFLSYADAASAVTANLTSQTASGGGGADSFTNILGLGGSGFDDILTGNTGNNYLSGNDGNDTLDGGLGTDQLHGEDGDDILKITTAVVANEVYDGGAGTDTISIAGGQLNGTTYLANFTQTGISLNSIEKVTFQSSPGNATAQFLLSQIGSGLDSAAVLDGGAFRQTVSFLVTAGGTYSAPSGFSLTNWTPFTYADFLTFDQVSLIAATASAVTFNGSANSDSLIGNTGADTLTGNGGNDVLFGGAGADIYSGGAGDDMILVGSTTPGYTENYSLETFDGGANVDSLQAIGDVNFNGTLTNFEGLAFSPTIASDITARWSVFQSLGANAQILGVPGLSQSILVDESLAGAPVTIDISGWTFLNWTTYDFTTPANTDSIEIDGSPFADTLTGSSQGDFLEGEDGDDVLHGGAGADSLDGWAGRDQLFGEAGDDVLHIFFDEVSGNEVLDGGANTDTLEMFGTINATAFTLTSLEKLVIEPDVPTTITETFASTQLGGGLVSGFNVGVDRSFTPAVQANVQINYSAGASVNLSSWTFGAGWTATDKIIHQGSAIADTMVGSSATDYMDGGAGADNMSGGDGNDTYVVDNAGDLVTEASNQGTDLVQTALSSYSLTVNVENLTYTGSGAFLGIGNASNNLFTGGTGADTVFGGAGDDTFNGNTGNDGAILGDGNDAATLGDGNDYAYGGLGNDNLNGGNGSDILLGEDGNDTLTGGDIQDYLFGGAGDDTINGDAGVDVIIGDVGNDTLNGGDGDDYIYAGPGADTASGGNGNDLFVMESGDDIINGDAGNDFVYAGDGNDTINGGDGGDILLGEAGDDVINPGLSVDYVFLGTGNDTLIVDKNAAGLNVTVLYDFTPGAGDNDVLRLLNTGWTSIAQVQAATFDTGNGYSILSLDADTAIWMIGVTPSQLIAGDVLFS